MTIHQHRTIPIAIVGMACRLPGADDLGAFWQLVREGRSACSEIPADRLDRDLYFSPTKGGIGTTYSTRAGLVNYRAFPWEKYSRLVGLSDDDFDVAHLTICDVTREALLHAGMDPFDLRYANTGVYVGHTAGSRWGGNLIFAEYIDRTVAYLGELPSLSALGPKKLNRLGEEIVAEVRASYPSRDALGGPNLSANRAAGLISRAFAFEGPYMAIDAACASSLKALTLAVRALQQGRIDMAIAGGASYCTPESLVLFSQAQSVSASESRPFDADADGLVTAEGYVAVVLKTLEKAIADGDPIQAVVSGVGLASDGKGKSLWAPRREGQILAMQRVYEDNIDPSTIQYIEAHATSTQVGDATELTALGEVLEQYLPAGCKVPMGSVKGNIGHTLETAGIAGLLKVVLAMQNGTIPPAANVNKLNPKVDWKKAPYFIPLEAMPWDPPAPGQPRRAAVNAFGIGGLNAHLIVDEYLAGEPLASYQSSPSLTGGKDPGPSVDEPIAIVGMGALLPGAKTVDEYWDLLMAGRDPKTPYPRERWLAGAPASALAARIAKIPTTSGGFIPDYKYDWRRHKVPPKQVRNANPLQFMLLDAAEQALEQAGYSREGCDRSRIGVVVGTIFGGEFNEQMQIGIRTPELNRILARLLPELGVEDVQASALAGELRDVVLRHLPALRDETGSFTSSTLASRITKTFDLMGGAFALDAGPASGLAAVGAAMDILRSGTCDSMVCAAGQRSLGYMAFEGLAMAGWLAREPGLSMFDEAFEGGVLAEGAAVVVLKRLADARRDGDRVRGILRSVEAGAATVPSGPAMLAMGRARDRSGLDPAQVLAVDISSGEMKGEVTHVVESVAACYGDRKSEVPVVLDSLSAQMGDLGGGMGVAALIKVALSLEHGIVLPSYGVGKPTASVLTHAHEVRLATSREVVDTDGAVAMGVSVGSRKEQIVHAIVERGDEAPAEQPSVTETSVPTDPGEPGWRVVRIGAPSMEVLRARLTASMNRPTEVFEKDSSRFSPGDRARLAIVAESVEDLAVKLRMSSTQFGREEVRKVLEAKGIYCRSITSSVCRVAFLFPGQGSHYPGMLRELVDELPAAEEARRHVDAAMAGLGMSGFADLAWADSAELGADIWSTQAAVLMADTIMIGALEAMGVFPGIVAGHSFGEFGALVAAGAWTLETAALATRHRTEALISSTKSAGRLVALHCPVERAEQLISDVKGNLYIANYNAPAQIVVGGGVAAIERFAEHAKAHSLKAQVLSVPCPFHTPLLDEAAEGFRERIAVLSICLPTVPVLSCADNRLVIDPETIRENLVTQLTHPVRYVDMVQKLARSGPTAFVECGPKQTLTSLTERILGNDGLYIASDNPHRPGVEQLYHVRAFLECVGALDREGARAVEVRTKREDMVSAQGIRRVLEFDATEHRRQRNRLGDSLSVPRLEEPVATAAQVSARSAGGMDVGDLDAFLIKFVVDQTGYPEEIVELDADLEADLGIDSIKKAQLFGELAQIFPITSTEDMSLDDYPTLRHVRDFIEQESGPGQVFGVPEEIGQAPIASVAVSMDAPPTVAQEIEPTVREEGGRPPLDDLDSFLINFVVEETGYPSEIVEMDVDLEGDLGIDSIKKAQLFAELAQYFPIAPSEDLSLDDFPTLRHVKEFIEENREDSATLSASPASLPFDVPPTDGTMADVGADDMQLAGEHGILRLPGSPYEMGQMQGRGWRTEIQRLLQHMADTGGLDEPFGLGEEDLDADMRDELRGLADGSETSAQNLLASSHFLMAGARYWSVGAAPTSDNPDGPRIGGWWDSGDPSGARATIFPRTQIRLPDQGLHPAMLVTLPVMAGGMWGCNATGVVAGVVPGPTASSVVGSWVVKVVLERASSLDGATAAAASLTSRGPWALYVGQAGVGHLIRLESDGVQLRTTRERCLIEGAGEVSPPLHDGLCAEFARATGSEAIRRILDWANACDAEPAFSAGMSTQGAAYVLDAHGRSLIRAMAAPGDDSDGVEEVSLAALVPSLGDASATRVAEKAASSKERGTAVEQKHVMRRFVLRMREAPLPGRPVSGTDLDGAVFLCGYGPRVDTLEEKLSARGHVVVREPFSQVPERAVAALESAWKKVPVPNLMLVCDSEGLPPAEQLLEMSDSTSVFLSLFALVQRWHGLVKESGREQDATLVAATRLGGDFGFHSGSDHVLDGAVAGMLKAIRRESPHILVKVLDSDPDESPILISDVLLSELGARTPEVEIGLVDGNRHLVAAVAESVPAVATGEPIERGVWVVTGGARGITAVAASALARRFGVRIHLLGTSPMPDIDPEWRGLTEGDMADLRARVMREAVSDGEDAQVSWSNVRKAIEIDRNLRAMTEEGVGVVYHQCDISDREQLRKTLIDVRAADGAIQGILHGAGFEHSTRLGKKKRGNVELTYRAKIQGALNLFALTRDDPLAAFVGFGSNSGRFGGHGQADYSAASDMLCKLTGWLRINRSGCVATSFHWPSWSEVGMAVRPEVKASLERAGLAFIGPAEGSAFLLDEAMAGLGESEVLVIDRGFLLDSDGIIERGEQPEVKETAANSIQATGVSQSPMIEGVRVSGGVHVAQVTFDPVRDTFLQHHRLRGNPILPVVIVLETFAEAVHCLDLDRTIAGFSQVDVVHGLAFRHDEPLAMEVRITPESHRARCELVGDFYGASGNLIERERVFCRGNVDFLDGSAAGLDTASGEPMFPYQAFEYPEDEEFLIWHGEALRTLQACSMQRDGGRAKLRARPTLELAGMRTGDRWFVPAAVLDGCLVACGVYQFWMMEGRVEIPRHIRTVRLNRSPCSGEDCTMRMFYRERTGNRNESFDFAVFGDNDEVLFSVEGYETVPVTHKI